MRASSGGADQPTGSHDVGGGAHNNFTRHGGAVIGFRNASTGESASAAGGSSLVLGGWNDQARASFTPVAGGLLQDN